MISAIVLSHNDENSIEKTISSLLWCNEIILIDDFSADRTVNRAKQFPISVVTHHLKNDFAKQRNLGLSQAKNEWVLFIDSDEVVSEVLKNEILHAVRNPTIQGYMLRRQDYFEGKILRHGETNRVRLLRLARKNAGTWKRPVHEVWEVTGLVGNLVEPLQHFPHPNVAQFVADIDTYSTLNARYLFEQGIHVPWWHIIAYPTGKFFMDYIWYMGFLDGTAGIIVAIMMSFHSFLTRAKLFLLWH